MGEFGEQAAVEAFGFAGGQGAGFDVAAAVDQGVGARDRGVLAFQAGGLAS
ncbi:hypothetical protein ACFWQL_39860 [Amycolatopsis thermoflava]|uniref:hypothetical protein n=1 Tax=Amycolatopsis thermoflava TaxID=84480 RepID=UPI0036628D1C